MNSFASIGRAAPAISAVALLAASSLASAAITGHRWELIDNSTYNFGALAGQATGLTNVYTFDLYLQDDGAIPVSAIDLNDPQSNPVNDGITLSGGAFYQVPFIGSDNDLPPSMAEIDFVPELEFDTYLGLGTLDEPGIFEARPIQFLDLPTLTRIQGILTAQPQPGVGSIIPSNEDGEIFLGRFSVQLDSEDDIMTAELAGEVGVVFFNGSTQIITLSNAFDVIPSPGSAALFAMAGLAAARRRR